jgi:hypothetical protein
VQGTAGINPFNISSSTGNSLLTVTQTGKVGIGTSTPREALSVVGSISNLLAANTEFTQATSVGLSNAPYDMVVVGKYGYVAATELYIFDISNIRNPVLVGSTNLGAGIFNVQVSGNYAYVSDSFGSFGFGVINVSDPTQPKLVSSRFLGTTPGKILLNGKTAFVIDENDSTVTAVDISNPISPVELSVINEGVSLFRGKIQGKYLYAEDIIGNDIYIIDISNPTAMVSRASFGNDGDIDISGSWIADINNVYIVQRGCWSGCSQCGDR